MLQKLNVNSLAPHPLFSKGDNGQPHSPIERFIAEFTFVGPRVAVNGLVLTQSRELPKSLTASVALEIALVRVRGQMPHEGVLVAELLGACVT